MQSIKNQIPNLLTCCNLICGCWGLLFVYDSGWINFSLLAAYLIFIAAVFDFFDGFVARLLNVHSEIGKQLDSLADMVSFGVLPAAIAGQMLHETANGNDNVQFFAVSIAVFSAIRLAKFNLDTKQTNSFIGLPTPANAILWASLFIMQDSRQENIITNILSNHYVILLLVAGTSFMLIAPIELFALKFKNYGWANNKLRYIFLALSLTLIVSLQITGIAASIILYILLSIINNTFIKNA